MVIKKFMLTAFTLLATYSSVIAMDEAPVQASMQVLPHYKLQGHTDTVRCVEIHVTEDQIYAISGSQDGTIKIWDLFSKQCIKTLDNNKIGVLAVKIVRDNDDNIFIASGDDKGTIKLWCFNSDDSPKILYQGIEATSAIQPFNNGASFAAASYDGTIRVFFDITNPKFIKLSSPDFSPLTLTILSDGNLAAGYLNNVIRNWNLKSGECVGEWPTGEREDKEIMAVSQETFNFLQKIVPSIGRHHNIEVKDDVEGYHPGVWGLLSIENYQLISCENGYNQTPGICKVWDVETQGEVRSLAPFDVDSLIFAIADCGNNQTIIGNGPNLALYDSNLCLKWNKRALDDDQEGTIFSLAVKKEYLVYSNLDVLKGDSNDVYVAHLSQIYDEGTCTLF